MLSKDKSTLCRIAAAEPGCYSERMDAIRDVLAGDPRIAYALVFGSTARGASHVHSDIDVAIGLTSGVPMSARDIGALVADLERAAGRTVDLVLLRDAPPSLAYRIFRDGVTVLERDHSAFAQRKARAVLEYLDFRPFEMLAAHGVLAAAARGR